MLKEFKKFALKGNMIDLAVGIIIGAAFSAIVNSLVNDLIMPIISIFTGKLDFTNMFYALDGQQYATLQAAKDAGVATINYGTFITAVINFVIMAFVIFMLIRFIDRLSKKEEEVVAVTEKKCPYCFTEIPIEATKCPHCTSQL
ncbi:MAG: large conductance mechanosensitive channel protein MscL [Lachnospiraceae bacterium]